MKDDPWALQVATKCAISPFFGGTLCLCSLIGIVAGYAVGDFQSFVIGCSTLCGAFVLTALQVKVRKEFN